jgi:hypothetical protein
VFVVTSTSCAYLPDESLIDLKVIDRKFFKIDQAGVTSAKSSIAT